MIVVALVVLGGIIVVNLLTPSVKVEEVLPCSYHQWYTIIDEQGVEHGLICIACNKKPGDM